MKLKIAFLALAFALIMQGTPPAFAQSPTPEITPYIALPGPCLILSHRDVGDGWFWPGAPLDAYPAVVPMYVPGGKGNLQLSPAWLYALRVFMTPLQWKRTWVTNEGWHNQGDIGRVQSVVFSHNTAWCVAKKSEGYQIDTYYNNEMPPYLRAAPDKYRQHIMTVDYKFGHSDTGGIAKSDLLLPVLVIVKDRTQIPYIPTKYVRPLVWLPLKTVVNTGYGNLNVRDKPGVIGTSVLTSLPNHTPVLVFELRKIDNMVWGRITQPGSLEGWVALLYTDWGY